jgi:DHA2 family multidrug resistance protein-like MFS transporter
MGIIILGIALSVLDSTVVNLALPGMVRDLHASASGAVWIVNAYQLASLVLLLPLANLGERLTYRRVYLVGAVVFTVASGLAAASSSLGMLAIARAIQGTGAAGIMAVNAALVRLTYPSNHLGRGIAINSIVVATSSVAGPVVAAAILSVAGWPWLFIVNIPIGIVLIVLGRRVLPLNEVRATPSDVSAVDVVLNGAMFVLLFLGADLLGASSSRDAGQSHGSTLLGAALVAACLVVGFIHVRRQLARTHPLLPIDLLRIPVFRLSMATSVCAFSAQLMAYIALPFLFLDAWHRSPGEAGTLIACWPLGVIASAAVAGRLIGRYPDGLLGAIGLGVFAIGLGLMALAATSDAPTVWWRLAICGLGFGLFQSPNNHTIITSAPAHRAGAASGMLGTARLTGQSLGAALLAMLFAVSSAHDQRGAAIALTFAACLAAAAGVFSGLRIKAPAHK